MFAWFKSLFGGKATILVSIPVGDTFPNREELEVRNRITDALDDLGIGEFVGAGGGFNQMDFEYRAADADLAKRQIAEVMEKFLPGQTYKLTVE